jgi:hypothetical protein
MTLMLQRWMGDMVDVMLDLEERNQRWLRLS